MKTIGRTKKHMKRTVFFRNAKVLTALLTAAVLCIPGCAGRVAVLEPGESLAPTQQPTPEPKGVEAVFGKEITITLISGAAGDAELFAEGAKAEAESMGITMKTSASETIGDAVSSEADGIIAYMPRQEDYAAIESAAADKPAVVYGTEKAAVGESVSQVYYLPGNETDIAMEAALNYPPHDTPVRLVLMFESADSASYAAYQKLTDEGKIFPKEVYIASDGGAAPDGWLTDKLQGYVEGMLDGVYADNARLALGALDALEALGRTDMEVFCPGVTPEAVKRMEKNPEVFAQAVGANEYLAGALSVRAALKAIKGEGGSVIELLPSVINASRLADNAALMEMGGEQASLLNEPWMDTLRSYYETIPN
jgi:ABC-type sugar transport system substrate-binding protein